MAFKVIASPTFLFTVKVTVSGSPEPMVLPLIGKYQDRDELKAWIDTLAGRQDIDVLMEFVVGWGPAAEVVDEKDQPLPFSKAAVVSILKTFHASGTEIYNAYLSELTDSRQKN